MKRNNRGKNIEVKNNYHSISEYQGRSKECNLEQLYVVPWELMDDDTKRWSIVH